ncbi:hypothetical protein CHS0354_040381 [Potamilus streckersoni]|uniref:Chloride channel protein n=1 Tax=Potamilus streckersoni TaxID=2493646 RepID=A0AAE0VNJ8_9BIVA|nr:hypothetical protein CHS0354_040381 [Potamilus streckersoni]
MAEKQKKDNQFGYEQTLIYGRYTRELGAFAKFQSKISKHDRKDLGNIDPKPRPKILDFLARCAQFRDIIFHKIGEDWIFLTLLGILMAILSFAMDYIIEKCQEAKYWLYEELSFSVSLQYMAWVLYSVLFILFATGFTHLVSPQAIGSGIPEMKTVLRGVVLKEFLTFRTLVAKVVGLISSIGSTLPIGKEGPFVHIASLVAALLGKISSFKGIYENESRRSEMLAAACAVGVAGTFAAPIGGVLFSIEVTATYFAVRNYWRGFFSAVCGALVFRLLALWFQDEETLTALFKTNLRQEFPFDPLEMLAFCFIGVACGLAGALFILLHRKIVLFLRKHKKLSVFLQKNRFIYPGLVAFVVSTLTFPPGLGQFFAGELTHRKAVNELFGNITWTRGQADDLDEEEIINHWKHPYTNIYVNLVIFIVMNFWMGAICNTLPIPAGVFVPVFTIGAAFGRLTGESMAAWFPNGIQGGGVLHKIVPGGYAVVGAAALSGSVTRTISTSVIVFELTGQISHVLPAVTAVLISNAVANLFQPSFYDSIILLKRLPYLPDIITSKESTWNVYVEDIMKKDVKFITFTSTYGDLKELLTTSNFRSYPLVDASDSMILLGSIRRIELERMLWVHLSHDQKIFFPDESCDRSESESEDEKINSSQSFPDLSAFKRPKTPPLPKICVTDADAPKTRFEVTKVVEDGDDNYKKKRVPQFAITRASSHSLDDVSKEKDGEQDREKQIYHTLNLPLRSILKKSSTSSFSGSITKASSASDLTTGINNYFRKLSDQHKDSILEDLPYYMNKESIQSISKHVRLPPEPVRVKNLSADKQEAWENDQLQMRIDWDGCQIDPAPFQLVERTSLHKVHSLFSLLALNHAYVTNTGRLVGIVALKELRNAIQGHLDAEAQKKNFGADSSSEDELEESADPEQVIISEHPMEFPMTKVTDHGKNSTNSVEKDEQSTSSV